MDAVSIGVNSPPLQQIRTVPSIVCKPCVARTVTRPKPHLVNPGTHPNPGRANHEPAAAQALLKKGRTWYGREKLDAVQPCLKQFDSNSSNLLFDETENFGDIGTNLHFGAVLPPSLIALLAVGGGAVLVFGTLPAAHQVISGVQNLARLRGEHQSLVRAQARLNAPAAPGSVHRTAEGLHDARCRVAAQLSLNARDTRSEAVQRTTAGACFAVGSLMTGTGTFLLPGFIAPQIAALGFWSNLLTGWLGNGFIAAYGFVELGLQGWTYHQAKIAQKVCDDVDLNIIWHDSIDVNALVRERLHTIKSQAVLTGVSAMGIGIGGLLTAITLFGYVALIPAALLRMYSSYHEQQYVGYTRRTEGEKHLPLSRAALVNDLIYADKMQRELTNIRHLAHGRYPTGMDAPAPISWLAIAASHATGARIQDPTPRDVLELFFQRQAERQHIWLQRQSETLDNQLREGTMSAADLTATRKLIVTAQQRLAADTLELNKWADKPLNVTSVKQWIDRIVAFALDHGQLAVLVEALCEDEHLGAHVRQLLRPTEQASVLSVGQQALRAGLDRLLNKTNIALRPNFFLRVEQLLAGTMLQYFTHLERELIDILVARLSESARLRAKEKATAPTPAPIHPAPESAASRTRRCVPRPVRRPPLRRPA